MLEIKEHRFVDAKQVNSPNFNDRPSGCEPELVVIHSISLPPGQFGGPHIEELFTNCLNPNQHPYFAEICGLEVSSHLLIDRNGALVQFVPLDKRAWHAGQSIYHGRENCNDFSIGIELEGTDSGDYTQAQYECLVSVLQGLFNTYPRLSADELTGHENIAPGRKTDPGPGFNWGQLKNMLQQTQGSKS
ncbi:MAG: 1,6-anhydro-N-acetylmuramyl-L-alanine amidase AmpD [Pseudomonadales bacterium]|nr:1,6-anhydro-N-acetylmuramyl-L-alanine amidase AmpD [Pseudomonadales bacterium]